MEVYLDNAATTKVLPEIAAAMAKTMTEHYGNPSSLYKLGREAKEILDTAREQVAGLINASPKEIIFTCGGSEGDTTILRGIVKMYKDKGNHIITAVTEHKAVIDTCKRLEKQGYRVTEVDDADAMQQVIDTDPPELLVLDIGLEGKDGLTITREQRARSHVGIILLTARDDQVDRIVGLEMGADDYVTKPFDQRELAARYLQP